MGSNWASLDQEVHAHQDPLRDEGVFLDGEEREVDLQIVRVLTRKLLEDGMDVVVRQTSDFAAAVAVTHQAKHGRVLARGHRVLGGLRVLKNETSCQLIQGADSRDNDLSRSISQDVINCILELGNPIHK